MANAKRSSTPPVYLQPLIDFLADVLVKRMLAEETAAASKLRRSELIADRAWVGRWAGGDIAARAEMADLDRAIATLAHPTAAELSLPILAAESEVRSGRPLPAFLQKALRPGAGIWNPPPAVALPREEGGKKTKGRKSKSAARNVSYSDRVPPRRWTRPFCVNDPEANTSDPVDPARAELLAALSGAQTQLGDGKPLADPLERALRRYRKAVDAHLDEIRAYRRINELARAGVGVTRDKVYAIVAAEMSAEGSRQYTASWAEDLHRTGPNVRKVSKPR